MFAFKIIEIATLTLQIGAMPCLLVSINEIGLGLVANTQTGTCCWLDLVLGSTYSLSAL